MKNFTVLKKLLMVTVPGVVSLMILWPPSFNKFDCDPFGYLGFAIILFPIAVFCVVLLLIVAISLVMILIHKISIHPSKK